MPAVGKVGQQSGGSPGAWAEGSGERLLPRYGVSFWGDENVLELDGGTGCTW